MTDAVYTLNHLFLGGPEPSCADAADANDSGEVDLSDSVFTLAWLFLGGEEPPAPFLLGCGRDSTEDALECESFVAEACTDL